MAQQLISVGTTANDGNGDTLRNAFIKTNSNFTENYTLLNAATDLNTASAIVKRDVSGNFSAGTITASLTGNATTVTNGVYTTGDQTIGGNKTFSSPIIASAGLYGAGSGAPDVLIWGVSTANPTWGIFYNEGTPDLIEFKANGVVTSTIELDGGNISSTGSFISTKAGTTTTGGGQIYLNGATGNRIDFNINGVAAPAVTTRSAGTKIVLYPQISGTQVDYAFGIESSTLWSSVPDSTSQFKWYAATTNIATLSGLGVLTKRGQIFNYSYENGTNQDYIRISGAANTTDYHAIGNYNINELFIQPNTYARILRGYAYTASNRKQTPADTAILIDASNTFIAYDKGNVNIGYTTDQGYKLAVSGSFAATTKSFLITHPTKEGMKLRYGSLEGPENGVYVRGRLKGNIIELPEYWSKLVDPDSITVQLTPIGKHQKLYVEDIHDNKVYIANDGLFAGEINCFYYVLAERCDVEKLEVEIDG